MSINTNTKSIDERDAKKSLSMNDFNVFFQESAYLYISPNYQFIDRLHLIKWEFMILLE